MILRYLMFLILILSEVAIGIWLYKRKWEKERLLIWSILVFVIGFVIIALMQHTNFFFDQYRIVANESTNLKATDNQVYLYTIFEGNREIEDIKIVEGHWVNDGEYLVYDEEFNGVTKDIVINIPVGNNRKIVFSTGDFCGSVIVESKDSGYVQETDLYSGHISTSELVIPASSGNILLADRFIKVTFLGVILGIVEILACYIISKICSCKMILNPRMKYGLLLGSGFLILFLIYGWTPTDEKGDVSIYTNLFYFENYELGFLSRGLVGQLLCEISPYWTEVQLYIFKIFLAVVFMMVVLINISKILSRYFDPRAAYFVIVFILFTPITGVFFTDRLRSDICFLIMYLVAVVIINRSGHLLAYLPLICMLIILINETTCLTIIPSILSLIIYKYISTRDILYKRSFMLSLIASVGTALVTVLFGKGGTASLDVTYANIRSHYEGVLTSSALNAEYYKLGEHLTLSYGDYLNGWEEYLAFILILLPIAYFIGCFYMAVYRKSICQTSKIIKMMFALVIVMSFSPITAMMIAIDFGRYTMIIFVILLANLFFFINHEKTTLQMEEFYLFNPTKKENSLLPFIIVIFLSKFSPFYAVVGSSVPYISAWTDYFEKMF